jgi:hypothetical protein
VLAEPTPARRRLGAREGLGLLEARLGLPRSPVDTVISLSEVRRGDFVVVEMRGPEGKALARSVVVTFRSHEGAGGPAPLVK